MTLRRAGICLTLLVFVVGFVAMIGVALASPPVDADGRPLIKKLGTIAIGKVECTPLVFNDKLYYFDGSARADCFHFIDCETGKELPRFAHGWKFGSAFVDGDTVYVTGSNPNSEEKRKQVRVWASKDLENWDTWLAFDLPGFKIFNTSVCKAGEEYVMMFEIELPADQAGAWFTARFATSKDFKRWTLTPPECVYAKDRYTAPHCLRFHDGYYYNFFLENIRGGYEQFVVRSKDLVHWESSPLNPVLSASDADRAIRNPSFTEEQRHLIATARNINNSDIDFCEHQGRLIILYCWGNQEGIEHLAEAVYEGSMADFLQGWFPKAE